MLFRSPKIIKFKKDPEEKKKKPEKRKHEVVQITEEDIGEVSSDLQKEDGENNEEKEEKKNLFGGDEPEVLD